MQSAPGSAGKIGLNTFEGTYSKNYGCSGEQQTVLSPERGADGPGETADGHNDRTRTPFRKSNFGLRSWRLESGLNLFHIVTEND